jgi:hypothetical protein
MTTDHPAFPPPPQDLSFEGVQLHFVQVVPGDSAGCLDFRFVKHWQKLIEI